MFEHNQSSSKQDEQRVMGASTSSCRITTATMNDVPFFSIILRPVFESIRTIWGSFCALRWLLTRPLNTLIFPKCLPGKIVQGIPILKRVPHICIGEVRTLAPRFLVVL